MRTRLELRFRHGRNPNEGNRHSFQNKRGGLILWAIAWCSDWWKGLFTDFLEAGSLLYLTLCDQKLWHLMLPEEKFDQHAHNLTCFKTLNLGLGFILQDCCSGWNPYVGDHHHHHSSAGEGALSLCIRQHCTRRSPGIIHSCWRYTLDLLVSICGDLLWRCGIV